MTRTNFGNLLLLQHQQQIAAALVTLWRRAVVAYNWTVASSTMVVQERDHTTERSRNSAPKLVKHKCASIPMGL
jgi:hypothetical protein